MRGQRTLFAGDLVLAVVVELRRCDISVPRQQPPALRDQPLDAPAPLLAVTTDIPPHPVSFEDKNLPSIPDTVTPRSKEEVQTSSCAFMDVGWQHHAYCTSAPGIACNTFQARGPTYHRLGWLGFESSLERRLDRGEVRTRERVSFELQVAARFVDDVAEHRQVQRLPSHLDRQQRRPRSGHRSIDRGWYSINLGQARSG
eukprot:864229-Rhodomonas_salina.4